MPLLHCGFRECPWSCDPLMQGHFSLEQCLYEHLGAEHRSKQMKMVPTKQWDNEREIAEALDPEDPTKKERVIPRHMNALAYYTAAVCLKEQQHLPIIGPSLDRRMLCLLTKLCNSDTVQALICFACAQIHVSVASWTKQYNETALWKSCGEKPSAIQRHTVEHSLYRMRAASLDAFRLNFELSTFRDRFASDAHIDGNPFSSCPDLSDDNWEWKRKLLLPDNAEDVTILCCPEDVRRTRGCKHAQHELCGNCEVPLCRTCFMHCHPRTVVVIPMGIPKALRQSMSFTNSNRSPSHA